MRVLKKMVIRKKWLPKNGVRRVDFDEPKFCQYSGGRLVGSKEQTCLH